MERQFMRNSYRVLLTRARQGMVIFIPKGDVLDPTLDPAEFDRTAEFLFSCGVLPLDPAASMTTNEASSNLPPALVLYPSGAAGEVAGFGGDADALALR